MFLIETDVRREIGMLKPAVHPGENLKDELAEFGVNPAAFAP